MKRFAPLVLLALVFVFCAIGSKHVARASQVSPPVYDVKNMAGNNCHLDFCSWVGTNLDEMQHMLLQGTGPSRWTPQSTSSDPASATCQVTCPIVRDRIVDWAGVRGAWIEVYVPPMTGFDTSHRSVSCRLIEVTGRWTLQTTNGPQIENSTGQGAPSTFPMSGDIQRQNLVLPSVPADAAAHGASFAEGYSAIVCVAPINTMFNGYGWQEYGGENTDY